jgi:hypothetical protein
MQTQAVRLATYNSWFAVAKAEQKKVILSVCLPTESIRGEYPLIM